MTTPRVLELFAGCGGAALGLSRAGWRHVACVERDEAACATLVAAGLPVLRADVRAVDWAPFASVDLVWASPPCQPGSAAGKRRGPADERDGWPATLAALDALRPTWFLAENVLGWTFHAASCQVGGGCVGCAWEREILPALAARFPFSGTWRLDAADFGVPQHRRRLIVWGGPVPIPPPAPTHADPAHADVRGLTRWRTLGEAVGDTLFADDVCDRRACYPCDGSHGRACTEPWRRDRPAPTVTTTEVKGTRAHAPAWGMNGGPDRVSDAAFLVAGIRRIEVDEGLVLQGFPRDWPLQGTREDRYRQVGNAVPPELSRAVGSAVGATARAVRALEAKGVSMSELAGALRRAA